METIFIEINLFYVFLRLRMTRFPAFLLLIVHCRRCNIRKGVLIRHLVGRLLVLLLLATSIRTQYFADQIIKLIVLRLKRIIKFGRASIFTARDGTESWEIILRDILVY